jgi:hypothetical protein
MPVLTRQATTTVPLPVHPVPLGLTYTDPDGTVWPLGNRRGGVQATACSGISGPPPSLTSAALPGGGAVPLSYRTGARTIILGMHISGTTQDEFLARQDAWARAIWNERNGDPAAGVFAVTRPDGSARQIEVFHTAGGDQADDDPSKSGLLWSTYTLTFSATDPLWADSTPITLTFGSFSATGVPPMPPIVLAPATLLGDTTVVNEGDAVSYPVWTITGPGQPTLTNNTTGRSFGLGVTLSDGETVTINTRPTMASAVDGTGADRWGDLLKSSPRDLWPLAPGLNSLSLLMDGSGDGSQVQLSYTRRWLRS